MFLHQGGLSDYRALMRSVYVSQKSIGTINTGLMSRRDGFFPNKAIGPVLNSLDRVNDGNDIFKQIALLERNLDEEHSE